MYPADFGLIDFADILYRWSSNLYEFWVYIVTTSAHDFLVMIEGQLLVSVVGTIPSVIISAYINIINIFNSGYLQDCSLLEWMLGGLLKVFVVITVMGWLNRNIYDTYNPS